MIYPAVAKVIRRLTVLVLAVARVMMLVIGTFQRNHRNGDGAVIETLGPVRKRTLVVAETADVAAVEKRPAERGLQKQQEEVCDARKACQQEERVRDVRAVAEKVEVALRFEAFRHRVVVVHRPGHRARHVENDAQRGDCHDRRRQPYLGAQERSDAARRSSTERARRSFDWHRAALPHFAQSERVEHCVYQRMKRVLHMLRERSDRYAVDAELTQNDATRVVHRSRRFNLAEHQHDGENVGECQWNHDRKM